jgi:hypothetical protein
VGVHGTDEQHSGQAKSPLGDRLVSIRTALCPALFCTLRALGFHISAVLRDRDSIEI